MLKAAQLYEDKLKEKFIETWYKPEYVCYSGGTGDSLVQLPDGNCDSHCFVSVDKNDEVIGYIAYNLDYAAMSANNLGIISFQLGNLDFVRDVYKAICDIFEVYHMNRLGKIQTVARILGYKTESETAFGRRTVSLDGVQFMDLQNYYTVSSGAAVANAVVKKGLSRKIGTSETATAGLTDIYAVKFDVNDGFHGISLNGSSVIDKYLPDFSKPGTVKDAEVEMVAATVLKNTQHAGVLRNIKIA